MSGEKLYVASETISEGPLTGQLHSFIIYDPNVDGDDDPFTFGSNGESESLILRAGTEGTLGGTWFNVIVEAGVKFSESKDDKYYKDLTLSEQNLTEIALRPDQDAALRCANDNVKNWERCSARWWGQRVA
ncbi:MAG: hypothetical protein WC043_01925 [Pseudobdellovibrionaceae bacterium]